MERHRRGSRARPRWVRTCQAAEGQGPGGLVCWWLQSRTHPECCEARPAQPGAETPPCKRARGGQSPALPQPPPCLWGPSFPAFPLGPPAPLCPGDPSTKAPLLLSVPHPAPRPPFRCYTILELEWQELLGLWRLLQPVSHPSVLDPRLQSGSDPHLSITPPESPLRPRLGARESSSSKKITQGAAALALANTEERKGPPGGGSSGGCEVM